MNNPNPIPTLPTNVLEIANQKVDSLSFEPNISPNPIDFAYSIVNPKDNPLPIHQFIFQTHYENLMTTRFSLIHAASFNVDPITPLHKDAVHFINYYSYAIGIKKSIPSHINIIFGARFTDDNVSGALDYECYSSLFTVRQENVTRYFIFEISNQKLLEFKEDDFLSILKKCSLTNFIDALLPAKEKKLLNELIPNNEPSIAQLSFKTLKI